jgi:hypothetical protein
MTTAGEGESGEGELGQRCCSGDAIVIFFLANLFVEKERKTGVSANGGFLAQSYFSA